MDTIVIYSTQNSNRLTYVLDWLFKERLQLHYIQTKNKGDTNGAKCSMLYGDFSANTLSIPATTLLFGQSVQEQKPLVGEWDTLPTIFATDTPGYSLPFDLFAAIFYLITRYEEYYSYTPDKHGRYPAVESILFQQGWLSEPIVDEWVEAFRKILEEKWGIVIKPANFVFQPTYDIDIAYSHSFKGIKRLTGAYIRALLKGDVQQINERTQVLKKKKTDPYDSFAWLKCQHHEHHYKPLYFILSALKTSPFDRNIHPNHPAMTRVIKQLAKEGGCGIHPSYYATNKDTLGREKRTLEDITGQKVSTSRQHYIKLKIPETYYLLADCGIQEDYSMGYGAHFGFRAGTGSSFLWYDIRNEQVSKLRVHPFCFMDTTAHYELGLSHQQAFETLETMAGHLKATNSTLITIFHNFSLGTAHEWLGWNEAYKHFLQHGHTAHKKTVVI
jgi:hypothetical protein